MTFLLLKFVIIILNFYLQKGVKVDHGIEFKDACSTQFKCIIAISVFAQDSVKSTRIYFEPTHGQNKSDGLVGAVKLCASREVCSTNLVTRNARELFSNYEKSLTVLDAWCSI